MTRIDANRPEGLIRIHAWSFLKFENCIPMFFPPIARRPIILYQGARSMTIQVYLSLLVSASARVHKMDWRCEYCFVRKDPLFRYVSVRLQYPDVWQGSRKRTGDMRFPSRYAKYQGYLPLHCITEYREYSCGFVSPPPIRGSPPISLLPCPCHTLFVSASYHHTWS